MRAIIGHRIFGEVLRNEHEVVAKEAEIYQRRIHRGRKRNRIIIVNRLNIPPEGRRMSMLVGRTHLDVKFGNHLQSHFFIILLFFSSCCRRREEFVH